MMGFTKKDTLAIKGIAILTMMLHHCFLNKERFEGFTISFAPFRECDVVRVADYCKICVGIFVFISGYGLVLAVKKVNENGLLTKKDYDKYLVGRLISLLSGYWFVVALSMIICQIVDRRVSEIFFKSSKYKGIVDIILEFFGLGELFDAPELCGTWWYMSLAIIIVVAVPLFLKISKKYGYFMLTMLIIIIPRIFELHKVGKNLSCWLFTIILGMIFAEYNVFGKMKEFTITNNKVVSKFIKFVIATIILILCILTYGKLNMDVYCELKTGIFPVYFVYYCYEFVIDIKVLREILMFFGKHSMNIFLIHTFFRQYYLREYIYSLKHFGLIIAVLFGISLVCSIIIELLKKILHYNEFIAKFKNKILQKI